MEQLLSSVLGSQQQKQDYTDFVGRYQQGHPSEGYSDQEVANRYQQFAAHLPADQYTQSTEQAVAHLSPQERKQFMQWLKQRNQQHPHPHPQLQQHPENGEVSPGMLAGLLGGMQQQQPNMLTSLLTGGTGSSGGGSGLIGNPIAKAVMAGIVANAAKNMMK
jgi:hypothetical protein